MKLSRESKEDVLVIKIKGKFIIGTEDALRNEVQEALAAGWRKVVLDLKGITTIDSSGLAELVSIYTTVTNRGGRLSLSCPSQKVVDIMTITQLISVFDVFDSSDEAVDYLRSAEIRPELVDQ